MDSRSFWDDYFQKSEFGFQLTFQSGEEKQAEYLLPGIFHTWCKGNINNGKFLITSIVRELLFENETNFLVSVSLGNRILPIDIKGFGDFRIGAKNLIKEAALQSEHVDFLEIQNFSGILIAEFDSCLGQKSPIKLFISPDLNSISVKFKSEFEEFTLGLVENILHLIDPELIPSPKEFAGSGKQIITDQNDFNQTKHAIISNAWNSVFEQKIDWDKNYYSNGGDSIQAIRFISKIKSSGWNGEFGELLSARKISEWEIKPALNETENQDSELENSYPLSEMQQKIWTQSIGSSKGIYHEQFLFELDKFPEVSKISRAYTEIWYSFPQLRIKIEHSGNSWRQTVVDFPADFRALEIDQSPEIILKKDIEEGFTNQLMRCVFFKFDKKSYLLWSHHHVLLDGWSVGILIQRFIRLIDGEIINHESKNYQHLLVKKEMEFVSKNHNPDWETFFKNHEAQHFSSNGTSSNNFDVLIKENHYSKLNEFCQDNSCTPQQVFLTALSIVNYGFTGKSNSYIHGISSGRSIIPEHAETAIGLFIKNIITSWKWNPTQTLNEIIDSVKKGQQFSIENEYVSYDYLNQFHDEIPNVLFVFENYPYNKVEGKNISGNLIFNQELTGYPFTLLIMPDGESFQIKVIYDNGLFSKDFVKHVIDSISICVEKMLVVSDCSVEELFKLNEVEEPLSESPDWTSRIEKQLEDFGDQKVINGFSHKCISFKEVIDLSEKLNFVLDGLNPHSRIALLGVKNEFTPALVYSIMKCGFTYVPVNPSWPVDRINEVLRIANCQVIIIPDERTDLPDLSVRKIQFNQILSATKKKSHITIEPQSEAYVLFTSGSTGEPKGVQLTHANLSSFLDACSKEVNLNDFDFIFSLTNLGFDLSLFENLFGLYSNKTTVVIPEIEHLETCLINYPGGLLNTVPSMIGKLQYNEIESLKVIHTAGEPFTEQLWSKLKKINPNLKIVNWYGPTETTTYSTQIDLSDSYSSSVGTALLNENISVRDFLFCKLPEGIEGEVTIGGHGVANGYINSNSGGFVTKNNLRFYKTGDRGIIRDGRLFLKGRNDKQVKRLGQRFELGEVEQEVLRAFPETKRTIYIHQNGKFVLFIEGSSLDKVLIENHLSQKFPAYMRPDQTFILESFPENANGKIDVKSLIDDYIQNLKEELLGENDSELLNKLRQIDLFSSLNGKYGFIEQGGDSIVGLRLIGKLKTWGYQAEINNLLNASTLDDFIHELSASEKMNFVANKTDLTPIQQWFLNDFRGNKNHYNQSVLLEVLLPIETNILVGAIQKTLENLKLLSQTFSDTWQNGIAPKTEYFQCESEDEITKKCSVIQESFDLKNGPVAGSAVFELQDKKLFFISIHHFYCDGYSWRLILDELQQVLNFGGTEHHSNQVFGKVYQRFLDLGKENQVEDKKHYGESIQNPFSTWNAVDYAHSSYVEWEWPENETRWFQFNDQIGKSTNEKFLYLFVKTWQKLNLPASTFFFETHGRSYDGIPEITDSIGWFTQFYPTFASRFPDKNNLLIEISEELKNLPNNGLTYMAMENWHKPPFPVLLNFLGNFDEESSSIVRSSKISQGKMTDDLNPMLSFVELNAMIFEGKLKWMLRTHPDFDIELFKKGFNTITKESIDIENSVSHVSDQIDQDDLDAINDLLGGM